MVTVAKHSNLEGFQAGTRFATWKNNGKDFKSDLGFSAGGRCSPGNSHGSVSFQWPAALSFFRHAGSEVRHFLFSDQARKGNA